MNKNNIYNLKVEKIITETKNSKSIIFNIPNEIKNTFNFNAGQYLTLIKKINDNEVRRAYSLSSSPLENIHKICVKKVENGLMSSFIVDKLKVGDFIDVLQPNGNFILEEKHKNGSNYVFFAGGSGITPIISIIKYLLNTQKDSKIWLFYANQFKNQIIYETELTQLENNNFKIFNILESEQKKVLFINKQEPFTGRISDSKINYYLKNIITNGENYFFICGPLKMMEIISSSLLKNDIKKENIKIEYFSTPENQNKTSLDISEKEITIIYRKKEYKVNVKKNQSILAAGLYSGLELPFSCQGGVCSTCIAKVISGKVEMGEAFGISESEIEKGFRLTCMSKPISDNVIINYDE